MGSPGSAGSGLRPKGSSTHAADGTAAWSRELAPFAEKLRFGMSKDSWRLYRAGRTKPSLVLDTAAWNFLPGLVLLERRHCSGLLDGVGASM